jgi:hypothetical protein
MFAAADDFTATTVTVQTRTGTGGDGDLYAAPVTRDVFLEDSRRLVRSATGEQVVSEPTLYADPADAALFTPDSKVTLPTRDALVIIAKTHAIGDPDVDHSEVTLT